VKAGRVIRNLIVMHDLEPLRVRAVQQMLAWSTEHKPSPRKPGVKRKVAPGPPVKLSSGLSEQTLLILRLLLIDRVKPADIAKRFVISPQRVSAIMKREQKRVAKGMSRATGFAYEDSVRAARQVYGRSIPVAPVPSLIDFYGTVVAVNVYFVAVLDVQAQMVRILSTSHLARVPNAGARIRVRYEQGIGFIDGLEDGQTSIGEHHG